MKVLLAGADGMLGSAFLELLKSKGVDVTPLYYPDFDYADLQSAERKLQGLSFDVLINCTAYTQVDASETNREVAFLVNALGPEMLAKVSRQKNALLVHFSTDYVFNGQKTEPYYEDDLPDPVSVYGESKLAGEEAVSQYNPKHLIIRTSWLYGSNGQHFIAKMLKLAETKQELKIVADQVGGPTYTRDLAEKSWEAINVGLKGIVHITNQGYCSWADLAEKIFTLRGLKVIVNRCPSTDYPTPAARPMNSRLANARLVKTGMPLLRGWEEAVAEYLGEDR
ncbi:MAG: dTDP-4-dehydrorhamnose reductase [Candidatus Margulisiibacteriota bacterium]|jgi:dTDP-4-dehydrorhamnose reductase